MENLITKRMEVGRQHEAIALVALRDPLRQTAVPSPASSFGRNCQGQCANHVTTDSLCREMTVAVETTRLLRATSSHIPSSCQLTEMRLGECHVVCGRPLTAVALPSPRATGRIEARTAHLASRAARRVGNLDPCTQACRAAGLPCAPRALRPGTRPAPPNSAASGPWS